MNDEQLINNGSQRKSKPCITWGCLSLGLIALTLVVVNVTQTTASRSTPIPTLRPTEVFESEALKDFCAKGGYPLPVTREFDILDHSRKHVVVGLIQNVSTNEYSFDSNAGEVGEVTLENGTQYSFFGPSPSYEDAASIELILCTSFIGKTDTRWGSCTYSGLEFDVYNGLWEMTLYQAKTGEVYVSKSITAGRYSCPTVIFNPEKGKGIHIIVPTSGSIINELFSELGK